MSKQEFLEKNKSIFWDYKNINLESELWLKTYLQRIITFWKFSKDDLPMIKKHYKSLNLSNYWENYFDFYFLKYDIN
jgi:hypothetical protein